MRIQKILTNNNSSGIGVIERESVSELAISSRNFLFSVDKFAENRWCSLFDFFDVLDLFDVVMDDIYRNEPDLRACYVISICLMVIDRKLRANSCFVNYQCRVHF